MITSLFSVFDPSSAILSFSWVVLPLVLVVITPTIWSNIHPIKTSLQNILATFNNEVVFTLNNSERGVPAIIITTFLLILLINFLALYPQVFSTTSHLTITLPLSLISWLSIVVFGWINNTNHMLTHLVPQGTPAALASFMVVIEATSNLIRPVTLCVRLTANLIAGHLLISLLGNSLISTDGPFTILSMPAPLVLTVLESAVACIQAYVFITLTTLYVTEIKYVNNV